VYHLRGKKIFPDIQKKGKKKFFQTHSCQNMHEILDQYP
jgi:hypothetical protein